MLMVLMSMQMCNFDDYMKMLCFEMSHIPGYYDECPERLNFYDYREMLQ